MCVELRYWLKLSSEISVIIRGVDHLEKELEHKISTEVQAQQLIKLQDIERLNTEKITYGHVLFL